METTLKTCECSRTEQQVLYYYVHGLRETQIAKVFSRAETTIHTHIKNIFEKTGVKNGRELTSIYYEGCTIYELRNRIITL